jgi:hypothetical protein
MRACGVYPVVSPSFILFKTLSDESVFVSGGELYPNMHTKPYTEWSIMTPLLSIMSRRLAIRTKSVVEYDVWRRCAVYVTYRSL